MDLVHSRITPQFSFITTSLVLVPPWTCDWKLKTQQWEQKCASRGNRTPSWTLEGFHVTTTPLTLVWCLRVRWHEYIVHTHNTSQTNRTNQSTVQFNVLWKEIAPATWHLSLSPHSTVYRFAMISLSDASEIATYLSLSNYWFTQHRLIWNQHLDNIEDTACQF